MFIRIFVILILLSVPTSMAQTGGTFDLSHSLIASGGGSGAAGGTYSIGGTIGQPIAGVQSSNSTFSIRGGFWAHYAIAPTAAGVQVSGRVSTSQGNGIRNVVLTLTNILTGDIRTAISSSFGYYRFEDVTVGNLYSITVRSKRYGFDPDTRFINVVDEITDVDFIANAVQ